MAGTRRPFLLALVSSLAFGASLAVPAAAEVAGDENFAQLRPGVVIVEGIDGEVDASDPSVAGLIAAAAADAESAVTGLQAAGSRTASRAGSGITVTYVQPVPSDVQAVVEAAITDWNRVLLTTVGGPVQMTFDWRSFGPNSTTLGFAGPTAYVRRGSSFAPVALANTLDGVDYNPSGAELNVSISSDLYQIGNGGWYVSTGAETIPANNYDLYGTIVHEMGHGLGFLGSAHLPSGSTVPALNTPPDTFDTLVLSGVTPLLSLPNPQTLLTNGDLWFDIGSGRRHKLFAPGTYVAGSSFSHYDEAQYPTGQPGALMTPGASLGESGRGLDAPILGVMAQIGWPMEVGPLQPSIPQVAMVESTATATLSWDIDLKSTGTPPVSYTVEALIGGGVSKSISVSGSLNTATLSGLVPGTAYTLRVTPVSKQGAGAFSEVAATFPGTPPPPPPAPPPGRPVTSQYSPEDVANINAAANYLGIDADTFQRTGVSVLRFINGIVGNVGPKPLNQWAPTNIGTEAVSSYWVTAAEEAALAWVNAYYVISQPVSQKVGTTLLFFLASIDARNHGTSLAQFATN